MIKYEVTAGDLVFLMDTLKYVTNNLLQAHADNDDVLDIVYEAELLLNRLNITGDSDDQHPNPTDLQYDRFSTEDCC